MAIKVQGCGAKSASSGHSSIEAEDSFEPQEDGQLLLTTLLIVMQREAKTWFRLGLRLTLFPVKYFGRESQKKEC